MRNLVIRFDRSDNLVFVDNKIEEKPNYVIMLSFVRIATQNMRDSVSRKLGDIRQCSGNCHKLFL